MMKLYFLILISLLIGCKSESRKIPQEDRVVNIPIFNSENAFNYVKNQVDFGPRRMNSEAHENCKIWLAQQLTKFNFKIEF